MIMGDLFCGHGGWTKGFQAHGWECWGIDLNTQPSYPGRFIKADIAHLIELPYADLYCCSSPCEQFSVHNMKHFHPNPKWPWLGLALFGRAKELLEATGKPYIMENVRAAEKFAGKAVQHCGPFYFWGNAVPAIFPRESYRVQKGIDMGSGAVAKMFKTSPEKIREYNTLHRWSHREKISEAARAAEIPHEIASYVASTNFIPA